MSSDQPAAAGKYYQIGKLRFEHQPNGRWGVSDGMCGVANCRTPIGALISHRRHRNDEGKPQR